MPIRFKFGSHATKVQRNAFNEIYQRNARTVSISKYSRTFYSSWNTPIDGLDTGYFTLLAEGGADAPLGFPKGGHFEVKEGHPDFLQIT